MSYKVFLSSNPFQDDELMGIVVDGKITSKSVGQRIAEHYNGVLRSVVETGDSDDGTVRGYTATVESTRAGGYDRGAGSEIVHAAGRKEARDYGLDGKRYQQGHVLNPWGRHGDHCWRASST